LKEEDGKGRGITATTMELLSEGWGSLNKKEKACVVECNLKV